jgi:hypothetical protein
MMMQKKVSMPLFGAVAMLASVASPFVIGTFPLTVYAQTQGMERREDRRVVRQASRDVKHECNASGQASRASCRHQKHAMRQTDQMDSSPPMVQVTPEAKPPNPQ